MDPTITDIGVGGVIAILIIREVFGFLRERKEKGVAVPWECPGVNGKLRLSDQEHDWLKEIAENLRRVRGEHAEANTQLQTIADAVKDTLSKCDQITGQLSRMNGRK